jgi:hypothetical protein
VFLWIALLPLFAAVALFFKPLLLGIARAALLVVHPHLSKEERRARRALRDARMLQKLINNSQCPSHAAELRAMASRG